MVRALTDRSIAQEEKRRLILDAAVRVFARKGYHTCRVGDIAEEAGIAHGLLYHYFRSKEEVLETVFRETWSELLDAFTGVETSGEPPREQRLRDLAGYSIDRETLGLAAAGAIVLHCLPAHVGEEIAEDVLYGPQSAAWDEAENRLHAQKALLALIVE